jgi:hypothetical protein
VDKKVTGNSLRGHWARRFIVQGCEAAAAHKKWRKPFGVTTTTTTGKNKKKRCNALDDKVKKKERKR